MSYSVLGGLSYRTNDLVDHLLLLAGCTVHRDAILLGLVPSGTQLAVLAEGAAKGGTDLASSINNTFGSEVDGHLPMQCHECKRCLLGREHTISSKLRKDFAQRCKLGEVSTLR